MREDHVLLQLGILLQEQSKDTDKGLDMTVVDNKGSKCMHAQTLLFRMPVSYLLPSCNTYSTYIVI